jgi:hypothetical protein
MNGRHLNVGRKIHNGRHRRTQAFNIGST